MPRVCRICVALNGLKASDLKSLSIETDEDLFNHLESEHHIPVLREGESPEQTKERFYAQYPEASDPKTCKCPACLRNRGEL